MRCVALGVLLLCALISPAHALETQGHRQNLDPQRSVFAFRIAKVFGDAVGGEFTDAEGHLLRNALGEPKVVIELATNSIDVSSSRMLSRVARSGAFFGAAQFPSIVFESVWHSPDVFLTGGSVQGDVTIRGIKGRETFRITPAKCARPGLDCDVEAKGFVNRKTYGIGSDSRILAPEVELTLKVRFKPTSS